MRAHVDACGYCAAELRALCDADLALSELATPQLPDDLQARLARRLANEVPDVQPLRRARHPAPRARLVRVAGGLAAVAAVVLAVLLGLPGDDSERETSVAVEPAPPAPAADAEIRDAPPLELAGSPPAVPEAAPDPTPPALVSDPPVRVADAPTPEPGTAEPALAELAGASDEDVALILELGVVEDLELLANLDLLEALVDLGVAEGA